MTSPGADRSLAPLLLGWYDAVRRDLPFRRTRDPYAIWVSEVMLQQTQVATVLPYYARWMERFPSVRALAAADEDQVLHAFAGLGYYSRAKSLLAAARVVVERFGGELPRSRDELLGLPGIGPYSAGAIASIAYGERVPAVDGNVIRVLCRLFALEGDPARAPLRAELATTAARLVPADRPGDFNQALMELGATLCTPTAPQCDSCPLAPHCAARRRGIAERLPELAPRVPATQVRMAAALVFHRGRVAVIKLPDDAPRWAGMWQFPNVELAASEPEPAAALRAARDLAGIAAEIDAPLGSIKHSVTRYRITLAGYLCRAIDRAVTSERVQFRRIADLDLLAMPAAHRRLTRLLSPRDALTSSAQFKPTPRRQ